MNERDFNLTVSSFESQIAKQDADNSLHYGFVAQELQELYPNLVSDEGNGFLVVNYTGLIPVLVDAIKEQQLHIEELQQQVRSLLEKGKGVEQTDALNDAKLYQNNPNPFTDRTELKFFVPTNSSNAFICIYDLNGTQIMKLDIAERGSSSVTINAKQLNAGMYLYSLIIDGKEIDTKKMILTNN